MDIISDAGLPGSKPCHTPMEHNLSLTTLEFDQVFQFNWDEEPLEDGDVYRRLIGCLLYLTMSRPDISYFVQRLSQFMQRPKKSHMDAALWVIRYVKGCPGQGILFPAPNKIDITAFCDSD